MELKALTITILKYTVIFLMIIIANHNFLTYPPTILLILAL